MYCDDISISIHFQMHISLISLGHFRLNPVTVLCIEHDNRLIYYNSVLSTYCKIPFLNPSIFIAVILWSPLIALEAFNYGFWDIDRKFILRVYWMTTNYSHCRRCIQVEPILDFILAFINGGLWMNFFHFKLPLRVHCPMHIWSKKHVMFTYNYYKNKNTVSSFPL